ncbi:MAG: exonuclease SbcCD subunit D [Oscillospiraceae bacterium]|jgi:exonuclease SbcD|nr:exonuclease SbcCD subunit D [Oscillospiraceae bacterium]
MKILHTADWHIGKQLAGFSLIEDQRHVLRELEDYILENGIDVLVVAGDVYDKSIPSVEGVRLLDDALFSSISNTNAQILMIAGNHDNATRLAFGNRLYKSNPFIVGEFEAELPKFSLPDKYGTVDFFLLPYFTPEKVSQQLKVKVGSFNEAFRLIVDYNLPRINKGNRNVLVAHGSFSCFLAKNGAFSDPVVVEHELPVGGVDVVDISAAFFFDYVALGHLHAQQTVYKKHVVYSGSLLKYSVAEADQEKGFVEVDMKEKGQLRLKKCDLHPKRDLKVISGFIDDILADPNKYCKNSLDYLFVQLLDNDSVFDGIMRLRQVFGNVLGLSLPNNLSEMVFSSVQDCGKREDLVGLFGEFVEKLTEEALTTEQVEIVNRIVGEISSSEGRDVER